MSTLSLLIKRIDDLAIAIGDALQLRGFKTGGSAGQVPVKTDGTDFSWTWQNAAETISWNDIPGKPVVFEPVAHASHHAAGGTDELTADMIGAASLAQGVKADHALQPEDIGVTVQAAGSYLTGISVSSPLSGAGTPGSPITVDLSSREAPLTFTSPLNRSTNTISMKGLTGFGTAGQVLKTNATQDGFSWTDALLLDQTTPQSVINGAPVMEGVRFDTTPSTSAVFEGLMRWNPTYRTVDLSQGENGAVTQQMGQEMNLLGVNKTDSAMTDGQVVYDNGRQGIRPKFALARGDAAATSAVVGIITEPIAKNAEGFATTFGYVNNIKTDYTGTGAWGTTWAENDRLWVSKTDAGWLTNVEPAAPHHCDEIGKVSIVHQTQGSIFVNIQRHKRMDELSDINGTALTTTGQFPVWNQTLGCFDFLMTAAPQATGFTISGGTTSKTLTVADNASVSGTNTGDNAVNSLYSGLVSFPGFGTTNVTACVGNDSRLSDARTPTSHAHGNITNDGKIGTATGKPLITSTDGLIVAGSFGTGSTDFCVGNDARLSDSRPASDVYSWAKASTKPTYTYSEVGADAAGAAAAITTTSIGAVPAQFLVDINRQGFVNLTDTTIGFSGMTFTLTKVNNWSYYRAGVKYTITASKSVNLPTATAGIYYIYIDSADGSLTCSAVNTPWDLTDSKIPVATINYNAASTPTYWMSDERHGVQMDWRDQYFIHTTEGARAITIPSITGSYVLNSANDVDKTFGLSASALQDQDIRHELALLTEGNGTTTPYVVWYRTGASTWVWKYSDMPFIYNVGNTNNIVQYDNGGTMTDGTIGTGTSTRYLNTYILMTNKTGDARYVIVPGRAQFTTVALAQSEAVSAFSWAGMEIDESVICYRLTWKPTTGSNKGSCVLAATPQQINLSTVTNASSGAGVDHNTLTNLQGGTTSEYYHLTSAEHTKVEAISTFGASLIDDADAGTARATLGAVGLTGNETIAGNKTNSGQLELTGQSATNTTSAMTRDLVRQELFMMAHRTGIAPVFNSSNASGCGGSGYMGFGCYSDLSAAASKHAMNVFGEGFSTFADYSGASMDMSRSRDFILPQWIFNAPDGSVKFRVVMGVTQGARPYSDAAPLSARGMGFEYWFNSNTTAWDGRLFYYDTQIVYGDTTQLHAGAITQGYSRIKGIRLRWNQPSSQLELYYATPQAIGVPRLPATPTLTLAVTLTSNTMGGRYVSCEIVSHTSTIPGGVTNFRSRIQFEDYPDQ